MVHFPQTLSFRASYPTRGQPSLPSWTVFRGFSSSRYGPAVKELYRYESKRDCPDMTDCSALARQAMVYNQASKV